MTDDTNDSTEGGWWRFLSLCNTCETPEELNSLFELFFTLEEQKDMANRYLIVRDLLRGKKTQRKMADELQVSIAKITRGSNSLKTIGENLRNRLMHHIN